jgi:hypothetical protein
VKLAEWVRKKKVKEDGKARQREGNQRYGGRRNKEGTRKERRNEKGGRGNEVYASACGAAPA